MAVAQTDDRGVVEVFDAARYSEDHAGADIATCGACGRSWDDAVGTAWTPAPSARCPFEYDHEDEEESPTRTAIIRVELYDALPRDVENSLERLGYQVSSAGWES